MSFLIEEEFGASLKKDPATHLNILARVLSIFLKSGLFSGSSSQQLFTSVYTFKQKFREKSTWVMDIDIMDIE